MYNDTLENWVALGDKHRVAIHRQDSFTENPLIYTDIGCFPIQAARGFNGIFAGDEGLLQELRREFENSEAPTTGDRRNELVHYLEREYGMTVISVNLRGHSQGDWMDVILWHKSDPNLGGEQASLTILDHVSRELGCYFRGDVYELSLEELITYTASNGKTIERWEPVEDTPIVGDVYYVDRPEIDELMDYLEIDPAEYGVELKSLQLAN